MFCFHFQSRVLHGGTTVVTYFRVRDLSTLCDEFYFEINGLYIIVDCCSFLTYHTVLYTPCFTQWFLFHS